MFSIDELDTPVLVAPMAGGPSTPELVAAVANVGGLGFLAAGNKLAVAMAEEIQRTSSLTHRPFGVNLFVPAGNVTRDSELQTALAAYREELQAEARRYGCELPETNPDARDDWEAKIAYLLEHPVPFVSFMFGCPDASTISALHDAGTSVIVTVTDVDEALVAIAHGADALCVQGPEAGGHRGTHLVDKVPDQRPLVELLRTMREVTTLPLVAAGGITKADHVADVIDAGAAAVQVGTAFLRSPECGASHLHKDALASGNYTETRVTRAYTGRLARGLVNRFLDAHHESAPAAHPELNQLTRPLRSAAAAAGDPEGMALWAGVHFRDAEAMPAASILQALWPS